MCVCLGRGLTFAGVKYLGHLTPLWPWVARPGRQAHRPREQVEPVVAVGEQLPRGFHSVLWELAGRELAQRREVAAIAGRLLFAEITATKIGSVGVNG